MSHIGNALTTSGLTAFLRCNGRYLVYHDKDDATNKIIAIMEIKDATGAIINTPTLTLNTDGGFAALLLTVDQCTEQVYGQGADLALNANASDVVAVSMPQNARSLSVSVAGDGSVTVTTVHQDGLSSIVGICPNNGSANFDLDKVESPITQVTFTERDGQPVTVFYNMTTFIGEGTL